MGKSMLLCLLCWWTMVLLSEGIVLDPIDDVKIYTIEVSTTDTYCLTDAQSTVSFRMTVFGTKGEFGHFIPGGTDHKAAQKITLPQKDVGLPHEVSIYTTHMTDPWHVKTVTVKEEDSGRTFCFLFDKWIGWNNTLIWSSCQDENCGCHWSNDEAYMVMVAGPILTKVTIHLYGSMGEASHVMGIGPHGDVWEGWWLPNVGDIQKVGVNCTHFTRGPHQLHRVYVANGQERILRCFEFNQGICNPNDRETYYIERKCANVDCACD